MEINQEKVEKVNHPAHYQSGDPQYETIKVLKAWLSPEQYEGFLIGNELKYLSRYKLKNGKEDLSKSAWYHKELEKEYESGYFKLNK